MIPLTAQQIAEITGGNVVAGAPEAVAGAVSIDSRKDVAGACFVAILGDTHDGHAFVGKAIEAGATVVIVDRPVDDEGAAVVRAADTTSALQALGGWLRRSLDPIVVGITGSLGKTTTKEIAAALLSSRYSVHATPGNLNNHWGLPLSLLGLEPQHEVMVAEMAMSRAGEIRALARIAAPEVGVITNVAPAHMEGFDDLDGVAAAKGELAAELPASGTLIVNHDDPRTTTMPETLAPHVGRVVRFGRGVGADVRAGNLVPSASGWRLRLHLGETGRDIELSLPGIGGLSSFLAAAAVAWSMEVAIRDIAAAAPELRPLGNRGAIRHIDGLTLLDESYNASPVAMQAALETFAGIPADGRRLAVLGDMLEMGDWTERVHREAGRDAAAAGIDVLVAVGRCAGLIAEGAMAAGMPAGAVHEFASAAEAAAWLPGQLAPGDAILVKGSRGIHLEQVVDAVTASSVASNGVVDR